MTTTVIFHRADFDGLFCREIAHKFLPDATLIGWDYGDPLLSFPEGQVYLLDLSPDCFWPLPDIDEVVKRLIWIDHHKTAIEKYPDGIPGYRIDGVAACRLAYQWFNFNYEVRGAAHQALPPKEAFVQRKVSEPYAVRLAGEYDIWDKRDPDVELFQHGLRSRDLSHIWSMMLQLDRHMSVSEIEALMDVGHAQNLCHPDGTTPNPAVLGLLDAGKAIQYARSQEYREVILEQGFDVQFEGLKYLACNSHELDIRSQLFEAGLKPEHDGCLGFTFTGKDWRVSLYGVPGKDIDHSAIAVKYGGGGHRGACGFRTKTLPWL